MNAPRDDEGSRGGEPDAGAACKRLERLADAGPRAGVGQVECGGMLTLLLACAPDPEVAPPAFVVDPVSIGTPVTDGAGYDAQDGDALGWAFAFSVPAFGENPAWDTPHEVLDVLDSATIRDPGVCPAEQVDGDARSWVGGCRSSQGYSFVGEATLRTWTEDAVARTRWEGDLEVIGDREDPAFDRIHLVGFFEQAVPVAGTVTQHLDINLHIAVEGYWERHGETNPALDAWSDWNLAGSLEQRETFWVSELAAAVGSTGGFRFDSAALEADPACPVEAVGVADLGDGVLAEVEGVTSCDACARVGDVLACTP